MSNMRIIEIPASMRENAGRKNTVRKLRVAAYCRVSTEEEEQQGSFEIQKLYYTEKINSTPEWEVAGIYADDGISGVHTKKRDGFNQMIQDCKRHRIDLILTKSISRFARNTLDSIQYVRMLKQMGIAVVFEKENINTATMNSEMILTVLSAFAQAESESISQNVARGKRMGYKHGKFAFPYGRIIGYRKGADGKPEIIPEQAEIIRLIFNSYLQGDSLQSIKAKLETAGALTARGNTAWSAQSIQRILQNEKYCGDLVQKKTYTPDFLSHQKKYNRGQEEFVIIKDHHEPIVSRELFEEANRILDERSLSQEGKAKHSNRYPFSGKIKCGHCGASYVARYKTRKDGSKYKAWRCQEAAKHGSPHTDKAGNQIGCTGASIRNEDATHIMFLVTKELKLKQTKITKNLISIIESIIAMDMTGTDVEKLKAQIAGIEDKRTKLIDIYMDGNITKDEFSAARSKCDAEIAELQSVIDSIDKQQAMIRQQQELVKEISDAINEIVGGVEYDDEFYKHILDKMVVNDKDNIDVYLNLLPIKWSYTVAKASKKALAPEWNISGASVPISVKSPLTSP